MWKQDLTEFNTAHNKRITSLGIEEGSTNLAGVTSLKRKRRASSSVAFREGEEIINPGKDDVGDLLTIKCLSSVDKKMYRYYWFSKFCGWAYIV